MNGKIKIAIVDSGVFVDHPAFENDRLIVVSSLSKENTPIYGHGTAIYNILRKANNIAEITNFKIDLIEEGVGESALIDVLELIDKSYEFDIINLSLGLSICESINELRSICNRLVEKGIIIVSAFDNTGSISYPAAFENVIGVTAGKYCSKITDFEYVDDAVVNLCAKGGIQRLAWNNPNYIMLGGNSFACAHTSVQVAKFINSGVRGLHNILEEFKSQSIAYCKVPVSSLDNKPSFVIHKAAVFPFNKEMHSLIRYAHLLSFDLMAVYDTKYSAYVGATTDHLMKDDVVSIKIRNIEQIDWSEIDTLILGHTDELSLLIKQKNLKNKLIEDALKESKNVFAFDDIDYDEDSGRVYCPKITNQNLPPYRFGKLNRISKPVLGIYGTSSRQGKFTIQLELRKRLISQGYRVGQVGTEPSALLFGMDYVYPMGYNNSVYIHEYEAIRYLNAIMDRLDQEGCDIIITGSQSGTIPFDVGNISFFSIPQINYLLGTQPDGVVLCVNPYDDIEYIKRTILFIESSVEAKIIAISLFPMNLRDDWSGIYGEKRKVSQEEFWVIKQKLQEKFMIPVFLIGEDSDMDNLTEMVTDFFSE